MSTELPSLVEMSLNDGVAVLTLRNEARRNAITLPMVQQFVASLTGLEANADVGAVVVTGSGDAFCAGADLRQLAKASGGDEDARSAVRDVYTIFERLRSSALPTVAAVNGAAVGAGMNLALACDVRVVAESSRFSTRFLQLGLHPGGGHTWMLERAIGASAAKAMVVFHQDLDGRQAEAAGLAWSCVPDETLMTTAIDLARTACLGPRQVVEATKQTFEQLPALTSYETALEYEIERQLWSAQQDVFRSRMAEMTKTMPKL